MITTPTVQKKIQAFVRLHLIQTQGIQAVTELGGHISVVGEFQGPSLSPGLAAEPSLLDKLHLLRPRGLLSYKGKILRLDYRKSGKELGLA